MHKAQKGRRCKCMIRNKGTYARPKMAGTVNVRPV